MDHVYGFRFGLIMSVVAARDILPGEEILVSYNYDVSKSPGWYQVRSNKITLKSQGLTHRNLIRVVLSFWPRIWTVGM